MPAFLHSKQTLDRRWLSSDDPGMDDGSEQEALFELQGPDENGCVWACSPEGRDVWCQNLGPVDKVVDVLSRWLESIEFDERKRPPSIKPALSLREVNDRLAKRTLKQVRPLDEGEG